MQQEPIGNHYALVYLQPDDDLATICGKVDTAAYQRVILMVPRGNTALKSLLGMTILRRHAEVTGKDIAIVSGRSLRSRARRQGIKSFASLNSANFDARPHAQLVFAVGDTVIALPPYRALARLGVIASVVMVTFIAACLFVPSATVVIYPTGRAVAQDLTVTVSTTQDRLDLEGMRAPAISLETPVEVSLAIPTTGKVTVGDAFAKGSVRFTNKTGAAISIPRGTKLSTGDGIAFATQEAAILPAGERQQVDISIQALSAGTQGNVRANQITYLGGPLDERVSLTNPAATSGGTNKEAQGVSDSDVKNLEALVADVMKARGLELLSNRDEKEKTFLYPQTARAFVSEQSFSHEVGQATPWLLVKAIGRVNAVATNIKDLHQLATHVLPPLDSGGIRPRIIDGTFRVTETSVTEIDEVTDQISLKAEMLVADGLDEEQIVDNLTGRSVNSAKSFLQERLQLAQPPEIKVRPGWGFGIPRFDWRINLQIKESLPTN